MWLFSGQLNVHNKTSVVIGASQGVGAEICERLYAQGSTVVLVARTKSKLEATAARIEQNTTTSHEGARLIPLACDAASYQDCERLWDTIMGDLGLDADYIFNCAGSATAKLFRDLTPADFQGGIQMNYQTALNVTHAGFKRILAQYPEKRYHEHKQRHIIFFSSVVAYFPFIGYSQYAPMKAALQSLSHVLRQELKPYNFRVSCIYPGNFDSEGFQEEEKFKPEITRIIEGSSKPISPAACADMILAKLDKGYDSVTTDFIGWFLSAGALGVHPREWGYVQVVFAFILSHIMPLVNLFIHNDIKKWFHRTEGRDQVKNEKDEAEIKVSEVE